MDDFSVVLLVTYIYALFLLSLRMKVTYKWIRLFKLLLLILAVVDLLLLIDYTGNLSLPIMILVYIPIPYLVVMTYILEISNLMAKIGITKIINNSKKIDNDLAEQLMEAIDFLSKRKIGALITIERDINLSPFINKALILNANVSKELLTSIFITSTPLHDGAVIIRGNKILCAKAYYPSTERTDLPMIYGTRHRAAIGISEQSDALTIVVSEETGNVSVSINRKMEYNISRETLNLYFEKYLQID